MKQFAQLVGKLLEVLVVVILSAMSLLVFLNVVLRYGFNSSIVVSEEVSRYLFVWLTFLATVLAFSENQHVGVTMLTDKFSKKTRHVLHVFTDIAMLVCCYLMVSGSWVQFQLNLNNLAPISGLPQGLTYLACAVAGVMIAVLLVARMVATVGMLAKGEIQ